ncbi:MAG: EpsG family protein [Fibrobacter sp.]|nr:EpsG family protein [Fibrobacter sp.]
MIIALVAAIRYNYGNDYSSYQEIFDFISNREFTWDFVRRNVYFHDPGWTTLCFLFRPLGFFSLVAFLSVVQNIIYYLFVKLCVPKNWWVLGVFIYLFCTDLYVLNMSMMRQGFAVSLFVLAFLLIRKRNQFFFPIAFVLVFLAAQMHASAFILYPCLLVALIKKEWARYLTIPLLVVLVMFFLKPDLVNDFLLMFDDVDNIKEYKKYYEIGNSRGFSLGVAWRLLPFFVSCFCCVFVKDYREDEVKIIFLSMLGYIMIPFSLAIPMIGRLCFFFTPFMIASVPLVYEKISDPWKKILLTLFMMNTLYGYWSFFHSPTWAESYYNYRTLVEYLF